MNMNQKDQLIYAMASLLNDLMPDESLPWPESWHAPGLGEIHSAEHDLEVYCEAQGDGEEMIVSDELAAHITKLLNAKPQIEAVLSQYRATTMIPKESFHKDVTAVMALARRYRHAHPEDLDKAYGELEAVIYNLFRLVP